jgi:hypothetical protein
MPTAVKHSKEWFAMVSKPLRTTKEAEERRKKFLKVFADVGDVQKACKAIPVEYTTYLKWRQRDPVFKAKVDALRTNMSASDTAGQAVFNGGFAEFRKRFLFNDSPWFHLEIIDAIENAEPGRITLILMPPEHGKTTLIEDFSNMRLAEDPTYRITFGSEKLDHPRKVLGRVMARMEDDSPFHEYVAMFGPFVPQTGGERKSRQPWGTTHFNVWRKGETAGERDYSMAAIGITASIQGTRTDLLVMDDVQGYKSLSRSEEYFNAFRQDWLSRSGSKAPVVIIGTRVGPNDFYELLIQAGLVDRLILFPAHDEKGEWLWPERYSPEEYALMKRNAGEEAWARNYMQDPLASSSGAFSAAEVDAVKNKLRILDDPYAPDVAAVCIGLDPGYGRNAFVVTGMAETRLDVVEARADEDLRNTTSIMQILEDLLHTHHVEGRHPVTDVVIEDKAFQRGLVEDEDLLHLQERFGFNVTGHDTGLNKRDPNIGVPGMARSFRRQEIDIPWGDDHTAESMETLCRELVTWRPVKGTILVQDLVMALWFNWLIWRDERETLVRGGGGFHTEGLPFGARSSGLLIPVTSRSPLRRG